MKATNKENCLITSIIEKALNVVFWNEEFCLGTWGDVDNYCKVGDNAYLLLECEKSQKHPNTNVLKLYPFLEEHSDVSIVLLHYFFPENKAPKNRKMLCKYIANKMEQEFKGRFQYITLPREVTLIEATLRQQKKGLMQKLLTGEVRVKM
jgi:hypothetical protein